MKAWTAAAGGVALLLLGVVVGVSGMHARSLTTFVPGARPLPALEDLSFAQRLSLATRGPTLPRPENRQTPLDLQVDFRTESLVSADGTRLEGWTLPREGARGEVVLVPGYRASRDSLLAVADRFHEAGWRATLMDPRGVGGSEGNRSTLGWDESQDVAAFVTLAKGRTVGPVVVYGFSAGGAAALRMAALEQAQPDALVVEATFDTLRHALRARVQHLGAPAFPMVDLLLFWSWMDQDIPGWQHNPVDYAGRVQAPVLVLQGAEDWRAPPAAGKALAAAAPRAQLVVLEGTGHQPGVLTRPLTWERAVEGFLIRTFGPADTSPPLPDRAPVRP